MPFMTCLHLKKGGGRYGYISWLYCLVNSLFIVLTYALFSLIYTKKVVKLVNTGSLGLSIEKFAGSSPVLFNINII